jgi:hypothetical protein
MASLALTTFGLAVLAGFWALRRAVRRAPDAFEDEFGFHEGIPPRPATGRVARDAQPREEPARRRARRLPDTNRANHHAPSV